jgi:hypothetical protein
MHEEMRVSNVIISVQNSNGQNDTESEGFPIKK